MAGRSGRRRKVAGGRGEGPDPDGDGWIRAPGRRSAAMGGVCRRARLPDLVVEGAGEVAGAGRRGGRRAAALLQRRREMAARGWSGAGEATGREGPIRALRAAAAVGRRRATWKLRIGRADEADMSGSARTCPAAWWRRG